MNNVQCIKVQSFYRLVLILHFTLFIIHYSVAQDKKAQELYNQSIKLFGERKASEAIPYMEQAVKQDPNFVEAYLKLGQLYEFMKRYDQAISAYRSAIQLKPDSPASGAAYQSVSNALLRLGRYGDALPYLEKFQTLFSPQSAQAKRIARQLETARFGLDAMQHPQAVDPKPMSSVLQTTPSQYFPVLTADEQTLVFTALKPEGDEDLMTATFNGETWSPPVSLSPNINTPDNEGTASLSADGRTLVFTACQGRKGFGSCDLYVSKKTGSDWSSPENLGPTINSHFYESQPALSADGRRLYFVSDRPGGQGRRDIWQSDLNVDGTWAQPVNLGVPVNTSANEASPFIHPNGQSLFFASDGHIGMGGYDLFVTRPTETDHVQSTDRGTVWSMPTNLGYPINTAEDQASLFVSANGTRAYYSYEEQKEGVSQKSRLYTFELPESLRDRVRPVSFLKGVVADAKTKKPLGAMVELIDLKTNQIVSRVQTDLQTGQYTAVLPSGGEYALYVSTQGYLFKSLSFDFTQKTKGEGLTLSVPLEPVSAGNTANETLNNLFFETGRYDLADKSRTELDRLAAFLQANPSVKIEISGHTDDKGDTATNLTLSQKRAQAVVTYLTKAGIQPDRIRATGYGKTRPLAPNTSDENRQLNRRIEWRVL